jgi:hypothetical protein
MTVLLGGGGADSLTVSRRRVALRVPLVLEGVDGTSPANEAYTIFADGASANQVVSDDNVDMTNTNMLMGALTAAPTAHRTKKIATGASVVTATTSFESITSRVFWPLKISNTNTPNSASFYLQLAGNTNATLQPNNVFILPGATAEFHCYHDSATSYVCRLVALSGGSLLYSGVSLSGFAATAPTTNILVTVDGTACVATAKIYHFNAATSNATSFSLGASSIDANIAGPTSSAQDDTGNEVVAGNANGLATAFSVTDNGSTSVTGGRCIQLATGAFTFQLNGNSTGWTNTGNKGLDDDILVSWRIAH